MRVLSVAYKDRVAFSSTLKGCHADFFFVCAVMQCGFAMLEAGSVSEKNVSNIIYKVRRFLFYTALKSKCLKLYSLNN